MPATANSKKYKLHALGPDGKPGVCSFFLTARGCRSGNNCKFLHTTAGGHGDDKMVSSESEDDGRDTAVTRTYSTMGDQAAPELVSLVPAETRKPKRKKSASDPFANPKKKFKVEQPISSSPSDEESVQAPAPVKVERKKKKKSKGEKSSVASSLVAQLKLPIAAFPQEFAPPPQTAASSSIKEESSPRSNTKRPVPEREDLPMPTSGEGATWKDAIRATRSNFRYNNSYDFSKFKEQDQEAGYSSNAWVKTSTKDLASKVSSPKVIAIDCEMCESEDPVSGAKDGRALVRVSIVDGETQEKLLDTLVKPAWPVSDYRTQIHGITEQHLENVQFTLRHAQAFCLKLCTPETVVIGHAVYNDFAALRWEHHTAVDTSFLFKAEDSDRATVSLKDLAMSVLDIAMPDKHDSVGDARNSLLAALHYRDNGGNVKAITRTTHRGKSKSAACQLLVHRLPHFLTVEHIKKMIESNTHIIPVSVAPLQDGVAKTHVTFASAAHAKLAFESLRGPAKPELSGLLQKKVHLQNGDYIRVRCMVPMNEGTE